MIVVCLAGLNSSGKDSVADILEERGWGRLALSDIIREVTKEGEVENMFDRVEQMKKELGDGFLGKIALDKFRENKWEKACAVGLRRWGELEELRKAGKCFLIYVNASADIRFERSQSRSREGDKITREDFDRYDEKLGSVGLDKLKAEANYLIDNSGSKEELEKLITEILPRLC
jgi:dephospho-CoA kinase